MSPGIMPPVCRISSRISCPRNLSSALDSIPSVTVLAIKEAHLAYTYLTDRTYQAYVIWVECLKGNNKKLVVL